MTTWNFGGFQQDVESSMDSLGIFNNLSLKRKGNCSVDLKLGRIDEPIDGLLDTWSVPQGLKKASDSRLIRRTRKTGGANSSPYCLVEGCQSDFSNSREYHKRHKVCEIHAKTPVVIVAGQQQRFCQQCSRFHLLKEFDEIKRSCRKRLDGHNRRRRKVQPDPFSVTSAPIFHAPYQGSRIPSYPQILTIPEVSCSEHSLSPSLHENQQFFPLNYCNHRAVNSWQPLPNMFTSSTQTNRALSLLSLTNSSSEINKMDDIMQAADTLSMLRPSNSGTKHSNYTKLFSDSSKYNELFCSDNLWRTPSNPFVLEITHLVSGVEVTSCITAERSHQSLTQTELINPSSLSLAAERSHQSLTQTELINPKQTKT